MSVIYYNLPNYSNFLPILETMKDGVVGSFVTGIDNNLDIDGNNWSNLATTYSIKQYIDQKVIDLKKNEYLFEDYYSVSDSILQPESGTVINGNITNIFYPDLTKIRFNTEKDIIFYTDDIELVIPEGTEKTFDSFSYRSKVPMVNVLKNENLEYPLTWNNFVKKVNIDTVGITFNPNDKVEYKFTNLEDETVECHHTQEEVIEQTFENDILTLENTGDVDLLVKDIKITDSNILQDVDLSKNAYNDNGKVNCHWALYQMDSYINSTSNNCNFERIGTAVYNKTADNTKNFKLTPFSGIKIDDSNVEKAYTGFNLFINLKVESKNASIVEKQHLFTFAGIEFNITSDPVEATQFALYIEPNEYLAEEVRISDPLLVYDENIEFKLVFEAGSLNLKINNINLIPEQYVHVIKPASRWDILVGKTEEKIGFYGRFNLDRNGTKLTKLTGLDASSGYLWVWNDSLKREETTEFNVEYSNNYMTNGELVLPVFDPEKSRWSFDLELNIDKTNGNLPKYFEILSSGSSQYNGLNIRYNKVYDTIIIVINDNEVCDYATGFKRPDLVLYNHRLKREVNIPTIGKLHIKFEYVGSHYNLYCDELGRRKIGELKSSSIIEPHSMRLHACEGINIDTKRTYIRIEDKDWWNFNTLNRGLDYEYCNLDCSNKLTFETSIDLDTYGQLVHNPNNILRIPFDYKSDSKALLTFELVDYNEDYPNIVTDIERKFRIYQRSYGYISIDYTVNTIEGEVTQTKQLTSNYEYFKKYHFELTTTQNSYILTTYDENFNKIEESEFANAYTIDGLILLEPINAPMNYVLYNLLETYSNNFYWNCVACDEMIVRKGAKFYILDGRDNQRFKYRNEALTSDLSVSDIKNKVFFMASRNTQTLEAVNDEIRIVNNVPLAQLEPNIIYCDIEKNILESTTSYQILGTPVGGLYNQYVADTINHFIYPRHYDNKLQKFFSIKHAKIENENEYVFDTSEWFMKNENMSYYITLGEYKSNVITLVNYSNTLDILSRYRNEDLVEIYDSGLSTSILDNFVGSFDLSKMSCVKQSSIKNGDFNFVNYNIEVKSDKKEYSYYDIRQTDNVSILVGCDLSNEETLKITSSYNYKPELTRNDNSLISVASVMNMPYLFKAESNTVDNHLYSVHLVDNYVKCGDFNSLSPWEFECSNYSIDRNTLHIFGSTFRLHQQLFTYNDLLQVVADYKEGEELLLTFTLSDYTSGILYVYINEDMYSFSRDGTYTLKIVAPAEGIHLVFTSDQSTILVNTATYSISNISLTSFNKVANGNLESLDYWENSNATIESTGVKLTQNGFISQKLQLKEDKVYKGTIKVAVREGLNTILRLYKNDDIITTINKSGIYPFELTASKYNTLKLENRSDKPCTIEYIDIIEESYNKDSYLIEESAGWTFKTSNVEIEDNKLHIKGGFPVPIISSELKPNTNYKLSFNVNMYVGHLTINETNGNVTKELKTIYSSENVEIEFNSMNIKGGRLEFTYPVSANMFISNMKLEVKNYMLPLSSISYNWQTINDENHTVSINANAFVLNHTPVGVELYQELPILEEGKEYTIYVSGIAFTEGSSMKMYLGADDTDHSADITASSYQFVMTMGAGKYIKIKTVEETTAVISGVQLSIKVDNLPLDEQTEILHTDRNFSITELKFADLSTYEYYDKQKVGLKIGNAYATGYVNVSENKIENIVRSKEFTIQNLNETDIRFEADQLVEILKPNYVFMDKEGNVYSTTKIVYAKSIDKISSDTRIWYNMLENNYYYNELYPTNSSFIVYLIGVAYTDDEKVVFTENIQKGKKLKSYTKPMIKSTELKKYDEGLYDTPMALYLSANRKLFDTSHEFGTYILYRKRTSEVDQYNLDVDYLYVDYEHKNNSATWNTELQCFVSPYTLDEAIAEFHHTENGLKIYSLTNEYDIIEEEGEFYQRLTYRNPNNTVIVQKGDLISEYTIMQLEADYNLGIGTKIYWKN